MSVNAMFPQEQYLDTRDSRSHLLITRLGQADLATKTSQQQIGEVIELGQARTLFVQASTRVRRDISQLKKSYIFSDRNVELFLECHMALTGILLQAIVPLKQSFGAEGVFSLELLIDEDDSKMLYAVALCRGGVRSAAQALDQFIESWWLDHMTQRTTELAFVYRISR